MGDGGIVRLETVDETAMSAFKFACPVCGQHIECAADKAGLQMECPTCFRKLVVPQPSAEGSSSLVLSASEVHTRAIPLPGGKFWCSLAKNRLACERLK